MLDGTNCRGSTSLDIEDQCLLAFEELLPNAWGRWGRIVTNPVYLEVLLN
jgi:hypothetical protein